MSERLCVEPGCGAHADGRSPRCPVCRRERRAEQNRAIQARLREDGYHAAWRKAKAGDLRHMELQRDRNRRAMAGLLERDPDYFRRWHKAHPEVAAKKYRARRARKLSAPSEPYTMAEIGDRDGWTCQLCLDPVCRDARHPDPSSPSIDHIVPLSAGGSDLRANVQIAHLGCNWAKGNRVAS